MADGSANFPGCLVTFRSIEGWGGPISWMVTRVAARLRAPGAWLTCCEALCLGHAIINLAPIPPLNGGRILLTGLGRLIGRPLEKAEWAANVMGIVAAHVIFLRITCLDLAWLYGLPSRK